MKKLVLLLIIALLLVGCTGAAGQGVQGQWGKDYQGVQAALYSPRAEDGKGEIITSNFKKASLARSAKLAFFIL